MVAAAVNENLNNVQYRRDQIFNLDIPLTCPDIPPELLDPSSTWDDKQQYVASAKRLARLFVKNFERFGEPVSYLKKLDLI